MKRIAAIIALILALVASGPASTEATSQLVVLRDNVSAGSWISVPTWHRLVGLGQVTGGASSADALVIVDTLHHRLLRITTGLPGYVASIGEDDRRGLFYLDSNYAANLGVVNLRTGSVVQTLQLPSSISAVPVAVDPPTGHIVVGAINPMTATASVSIVTAQGAVLRTRDIPEIGSASTSNIARDQMLADIVHRRLLVFLGGPPNASTLSANDQNVQITQPVSITALALDTLKPVWTRVLPYQPTYSRIDAASGHLLVVAPGGRVTVFDTVYGGEVGVAHLAMPLQNLTQLNLVVDWVRGRAFITVNTNSGRRIDVADWHAGVRRVLKAFPPPVNAGAITGALGNHSFLANESLIGIDAPSGNVVVAAQILQTTENQVRNIVVIIDPRSGKVLRTITATKPADQIVASQSFVSNASSVALQDGYLYGTAQVTTTNDLTGQQTVPAIVAVRI